jgi:ribosomal protein S18 acetylase RimI-like enzyme
VRAAYLLDATPNRSAVRAYLADPHNIFLLAYVGERPVGFLRGTELGQLTSARGQMFLYEVAVEDGYRRRGIGTEMVRRLLELCRSREVEEIFVFTDDPANTPAERLYRSTGAVTETVGDRMYVYSLARAARERRQRRGSVPAPPNGTVRAGSTNGAARLLLKRGRKRSPPQQP